MTLLADRLELQAHRVRSGEYVDELDAGGASEE